MATQASSTYDREALKGLSAKIRPVGQKRGLLNEINENLVASLLMLGAVACSLYWLAAVAHRIPVY